VARRRRRLVRQFPVIGAPAGGARLAIWKYRDFCENADALPSRPAGTDRRLDIPNPLVYEPRLNSKQRAEALRPDGQW